MFRRRSLISLVACVAVLVGVQAAGGAPAPPSKAPAISGYPGYRSLLTCRPGSWGADAASFAYSWHRSYDGAVLAHGRRYRPGVEALDQTIFCRETAADGAGAATSSDSAPVRIGRGRTTIRLKADSPQHGGTVKLTGKVGPPEAIKPQSRGRQRGSVVAYRDEGNALYQLFGKYRLDNKGRFSITAPDKPGRNLYKVNFNPNEVSLWEFASASRKVTLKR